MPRHDGPSYDRRLKDREAKQKLWAEQQNSHSVHSYHPDKKKNGSTSANKDTSKFKPQMDDG